MIIYYHYKFLFFKTIIPMDFNKDTTAHLTPEYTRLFFQDGWNFLSGHKTFHNPERLVCLFQYYKKLLELIRRSFSTKTPNEVNIYDNDDTLCDTITLVNNIKREKPNIKSPYSMAETLPSTYHKMIDHIKTFFDPMILSLICTGRKIVAEDIDDNRMEIVHQQIYNAYVLNSSYTIPNSMAEEIMKRHQVPVERVFPNIFNSFVPVESNFNDEITNEIHKAFVIYITIRLFPNIVVNQYDDQLKSLQLGYFGFICAKRDLEEKGIIVTAQLNSKLVNLKKDVHVTTLEHCVSDVPNFICFK